MTNRTAIARTDLPKGEAVALVVASRGWQVVVRKGHYDGKVPGGMRFTWAVASGDVVSNGGYVSEAEARALYTLRSKRKGAVVRF